jgi:hypothetical protein
MGKLKQALSVNEQKMFEEIFSVMKKYEHKTRMFGLSLVHDHFEIKSREIKYETNDPYYRTLTTRIIARDDVPCTSFPSAWKFDGGGKPEIEIFCCSNDPDPDDPSDRH